MAKYGKKSQKLVEKALSEMKKGELKSGKSKMQVKSRKQAIAIGLSEARAQGAKAPAAPTKKRAMRTIKKAVQKKMTPKKTKK